MALRPRHRRINPIARAPILRKGGAHVKSRSGERQQYKQQLKQKLLKEEAGEDDFSSFLNTINGFKTFVICGNRGENVLYAIDCERHNARLPQPVTGFFI